MRSRGECLERGEQTDVVDTTSDLSQRHFNSFPKTHFLVCCLSNDRVIRPHHDVELHENRCCVDVNAFARGEVNDTEVADMDDAESIASIADLPWRA